MAVITTATTTSLLAVNNEQIYIAPTGSITVSTGIFGGEPIAISNSSTSVSNVELVIDGRVVSLADNDLIFLDQNTAGAGGHEVIVSLLGILHAFDGIAIRVHGSGCTVMNDGYIFAQSAGVFATGTGALLTNTGTIRSFGVGLSTTGVAAHLRNGGLIDVESYGIEAQGDSSHATNSGTIMGGGGIRSRGDNNLLVNSGTIIADDSNSFGTSGGAILVESSNGNRVVNSGLITSTNSYGVNFLGLASGTGTLRNSGTISGDLAGISFTDFQVAFNTQLAWTMTNSGEISGRIAGINVQDGNLALTNLATGQISAAAGDAVVCLGLINLTNWGSIAGNGPGGDAIVLGANSGFSEITNFGTISTTSGLAINAAAVTGGAVFLTNHGVIQGAASAYNGGTGTDVITNFGTLSGIGTGGGSDQVRNAGLVNSFVLLSSGDDSYDGRRGSVAGYVDGGIGNDTLWGGLIEDDLRGGTGSDLLAGNDGDDTLTGSDGDDTLSGSAGDDVIRAGLGFDILTGGSGRDTFAFASAAEISSALIRDRIRDFETGQDQIDLSALPPLSYLNLAVFSNVAGQVRYQKNIGQLQGDLDGDGLADFVLVLEGNPVLVAGDLIL